MGSSFSRWSVGLACLGVAPCQGTWQPLHAAPYGQTRLVTDTARSRVIAISRNPDNGLMAHHEWDGQAWIDGNQRMPIPYRDLPNVVYDEARRCVLLFGGDASLPRDDQWEFDGHQWRALYPAVRPSARSGAAMAYDSSRSRVVLHGGHDRSRSLGDLWEWDGQTWMQRSFPIEPGTNSQHCMAFDSVRSQCVLFDNSGDTWSYDGSAWTRQLVNGSLTPPTRWGATMTFEPVRRRIVLAGGSPLGGTWEWDGAGWLQIDPFSPTTTHAGLAFEPISRHILLAGGEEWSVNSQFVGRSSATFAYDGTAWALVRPDQTFVEIPALTWDSGRRRIVALAGWSTWETNGIFLEDQQRASSYLWQLPDWGGEIAYDPVRRLTVVFGGNSWGQAGMVNWTSTWNGAGWIQAATGPSARLGHRMAFDSVSNSVLLFGGWGNGNTSLDDTWSFNGTWVQRQPVTRPPARSGMAMESDPVRQRIVMFGGMGTTGDLGDTWEWNGANWVRMSPSISPTVRENAAMAFDPSRARMLLHGGILRSGQLVPGTVWAWDGMGWTDLGIQWEPSNSHTFIYAPDRQAFVMFRAAGRFARTLQLSTHAPASTSMGMPCGSARLGTDLPYLGNLGHRLEVLDAPPNAPCVFAYALDTLPQPLGNGCTWHLAGATSGSFALANAQGFAAVQAPIRFDLALRGIQLFAQAAVLDPSGPFAGVAITAARQLNVGD